ncbi:hypothetical protein WR25_01858 [Diploscapter pachys]|uniref:EF-hand domain-containing protein n=1 Tax=Diploscapter pachys TaxID=2018661 RepID=A0A2A2J5Q1_9BILA|nr:hypothetical protein WR25_01858 [Diploscapter pachys]
MNGEEQEEQQQPSTSENEDEQKKTGQAERKQRQGQTNGQAQAHEADTVRNDDTLEDAVHRVAKKDISPLLTKPQTKHKPLIQASIPKEKAIAIASTTKGLTAEKEKRLRALYDRLDIDQDGTIDIRDLQDSLRKENPHIPVSKIPELLKLINKKAGRDPQASDQKVSFGEFLDYAVEHEQRLEAAFQELDHNKDGLVDVGEIRKYYTEQGIPMDENKARAIVRKMSNESDSSHVDLQEFQNFMILYPSTDLKNIADFWRHNLVIDIGEDSQVPEDFSAHEMQSGIWWRHLVAGGVAGAMSRTCTAPFDRIKIYLQVHSSRENPMRVMSCIRLLHAEGGLKSFWRGNGINVVKIAPESALKFMCYDQLKRWIQKYKGSSELSVIERLLAGSSAGAISQSVIYPMEVLKTRLALRRTGQMDHGILHFAHKMYLKEGLFCFYKGYIPNLLGIIPYAGIDLAVYETLKKVYTDHHKGQKEPGVVTLLACGTCSSTCGQLASYPLALVRTRLQAKGFTHDSTQPDSMVGQFRYILRNEGFFGLYRGIAPNFMKVIPAVSISYVVYETVRKRLGANMS